MPIGTAVHSFVASSATSLASAAALGVKADVKGIPTTTPATVQAS